MSKPKIKELVDEISKVNKIHIGPTSPAGDETLWLKTGKNLFDKNSSNLIDGYIDTSAMKVEASVESKMVFIEVKPNTQYTISRIPGKTFRVGTTATILSNQTAVIGTNANHEGTSITYTTEPNAKYLFVNFHNNWNGEIIDYQTIMDTIQIEQGSVATQFEEYVDKEIYVKNNNGVWTKFYDEVKTSIVNHSFLEQIVGKWVDGKPLYKRTIDFGNLPNAGTKEIVVAGLDNEIIRKMEGIATNTGSGDAITIPYCHPTAQNNVNLYYGRNGHRVSIEAGTNRSGYKAYVTLYYTKTTN